MNKNLQSYLKKPLEHLDTIRGAFSLCANFNELSEVIDLIPTCFGHFVVDEIEPDYFIITNDSNDYIIEEEKYSWYEAEDLDNRLSISVINKMKAIAYDNYNCGYLLSEDDLYDFVIGWEDPQYNMKAIVKAFAIARGENF